MFKKSILTLLLATVVTQPIMAVQIDTAALTACLGALNETKNLDAISKCIEKCATSSPLVKAVERTVDLVTNPVYVAGALALGAALFYLLIWPNVGIHASLTFDKNSRADNQGHRR